MHLEPLQRVSSNTSKSMVSVESYPDISAMNRLSTSIHQFVQKNNKGNPKSDRSGHGHARQLRIVTQAYDCPNEGASRIDRECSPVSISKTTFSSCAQSSATARKEHREHPCNSNPTSPTTPTASNVLTRAKSFMSKSLGRTKKTTQV